MTCRFLETLTLGSLIAPVPDHEFRSRYWEQQPLIVHRKNPDYYGDLFTLRDFDAAVTRYPALSLVNSAINKKRTTYSGKVTLGLEGALADMREGGTVVLDLMHTRDPKLGLLCRTLAEQLGHRFHTNLYLTPANGKGFTPHWDNHDVFVLQVVGSKHWQIEKQRRVLPARGEEMPDDEGRELRGETYSFTLDQGDLIYIPRGFVHAAQCGAEASLHITLGFGAFFLDELLYVTVRAAVLRDERLRAQLPLGFMRDGAGDLIKRVAAALREASDESFVTGVVEKYWDDLVRKFPLDVSGQVAEFYRPVPLTAEDMVGPRRGVVYRVHAEGDAVRINVGTRTVTFPGLFREALDFALNTPSYAVREVAGDLAEEERIGFIERLIKEGLVVRKDRGWEAADMGVALR